MTDLHVDDGPATGDPPRAKGLITVPLDPAEPGTLAVRVATVIADQASWGVRVVGSDAAEAVLRTTVPILVCGPHVQPVQRYSRIVVGLDGSDFAERALTESVALAQALGATLALLEVVPPDVTVPDDIYETAYLSRLRTRADIPTDDYDTVHHQRPAQVLIDAADAVPGTIIAVATHGRSGFERLRTGSVALDVIRHARCPVLVVPAGS